MVKRMAKKNKELSIKGRMLCANIDAQSRVVLSLDTPAEKRKKALDKIFEVQAMVVKPFLEGETEENVQGVTEAIDRYKYEIYGVIDNTSTIELLIGRLDAVTSKLKQTITTCKLNLTDFAAIFGYTYII